MALKATIFKVELSIADMDRGYYRDHALTLARHPSETDERMMIRLLAFALHASETLAFGRGLSTEDEPALSQRDLTNAISLWIDVGLPDERDVRRAVGRADAVRIYTYGGRAVDVWWNRVGDKLSALDRVTVIDVPKDASDAMAKLARRNMQLQCTVQEGHIWLGDGAASVAVELRPLKG